MTVQPKPLPRGIRNNNPGNIDYNPKAGWLGLADPPSDGRFCRFTTPAFGIRALARTIITYQDKRRAGDGSAIDTVADIISRWAPATENNTKAYIAAVCKAVGVSEDQTIDCRDYRIMRPLVEAIIRHENGMQLYGDAAMEEGLALAGVVLNPEGSIVAQAAAAKQAVGSVSGVATKAAAVTAAATAASQVVAQSEPIWTGLQRAAGEYTPHVLLALIGLAAVAAVCWTVITVAKARRS